MKIAPLLTPVLIAGIILCLVIASGCTLPARTNSTPPALLTAIQTVSPALSPSAVPTGAAPAGGCSEGQTTCGGACRNTLVDAGNCGRCGAACGSSQYCSNGACITGTLVVPATSLTTGAPVAGVSCASGQTVCGGACRNTLVDTSNCGRCGNVCSASQTCTNGACSDEGTAAVTTTAGTTITPGVSCGSGQMNCGGTCVSRHDPGNCGACGNACGAGKDCFWSTAADGSLFDIHCDCLAGSGLLLCGDRCRNVQSDAENCGACGNICPTDQACTAGICTASGCPGGQTRCSGICTDLLSDSAHCGTCGNICGIGTTCTAGACIPTCPTGTSYCGGSCRNLQTDSLNCGSCGNSCPMGLVCSNGTCLASSPGGSFSMTCLVGYTDCGSGCTDLRTDVTNCGSCGTVCGTGEGCYSGSCSQCPYGYYDCGSGCSYLPADSLNCGYCGNACPLGQSCSGGVCTLFCNKGMTACPGAKGGSACVDLQTDSSNCGSCGNVCTTGSCSGGACGFILR